MTLVLESPEDLHDWVGKQLAVTNSLPISQERIEQFAEATGDKQWIHVDVVRASRESPYGTTIAHGWLTLSLLSYFLQHAIEIRRARMVINYGLNRVRFPTPVGAGSKIRARFTLLHAKRVDDVVEAVFSVVIEEPTASKPCCVAEWVIRYYS
jgi:acyl dehydratase